MKIMIFRRQIANCELRKMFLSLTARAFLAPNSFESPGLMGANRRRMNRFRLALILLSLIPAAEGATLEHFSVDGHAVTLKVPAAAAPGKPWLWVGEFAGHLASLESGLVDRGWHVAYVNVSNRFGSPDAMAVWEQVYSELHERRGLAARPALLGISRGGLYVNAWTRLHPDRVSALYLDNGVCDIRSWPGGFQLVAQGAGSAKDWALYKAEFRFSSDGEAQANSVRPADGLAPAARAGVLLISVHGTADTVVPYVDNAKVIVDVWAEAGGRFKVFAKEGGDHHPHGLPDTQPLIALLTAAVAAPPATQ
jgi:pimeloyl-ACP methyl ester carboxylesterase